MEKITIGKLAELVDVNIETIRFYHREGILKEPAKRANGYRYYSEEDASKITFIKKVKELLEINSKPRATCELVKEKVSKKIMELDEKINDLKQVKKSLEALSCACDIGSDEMKKVKVMDCFEKSCC
jgi:DNA-binding transcriptional MerR regulator